MEESNEQTYTYANEFYFQQIISLLEQLIEAVSGNDNTES